MDEKFTFFWGGPFSQWYPSQFRGYDFYNSWTSFNTAEQYMMAFKAMVFADNEKSQAILDEIRPAIQKALGRKVKNFNQEVWDQVKLDIVFNGNVLKFSNNPNLYEILCDTEGTTLVEASPYDKIWGIGLLESDPRCFDRTQWLGLNLLGQTLTEVRDYLIRCEIKMMKPSLRLIRL